MIGSTLTSWPEWGRADSQSLHPIEHRSRKVRQDRLMLRARDAWAAVRTELINATRRIFL
jgi:hypothetical protein